MQHTAEPWTADLEHAIVTGDHGRILVCDCRVGSFASHQATQDARRIVACVNLLRGIPTEFLEQLADCTIDPKKLAAAARPRGDWPGFDEFWAAYPNRKARADALKAWNQVKPTEPERKKILDAINKQKLTEAWRKEKGKFIPYAATWLRGRRWEDEHEHPGGVGADSPSRVRAAPDKYAGVGKVLSTAAEPRAEALLPDAQGP